MLTKSVCWIAGSEKSNSFGGPFSYVALQVRKSGVGAEPTPIRVEAERCILYAGYIRTITAVVLEAEPGVPLHVWCNHEAVVDLFAKERLAQGARADFSDMANADELRALAGAVAAKKITVTAAGPDGGGADADRCGALRKEAMRVRKNLPELTPKDLRDLENDKPFWRKPEDSDALRRRAMERDP